MIPESGRHLHRDRRGRGRGRGRGKGRGGIRGEGGCEHGSKKSRLISVLKLGPGDSLLYYYLLVPTRPVALLSGPPLPGAPDPAEYQSLPGRKDKPGFPAPRGQKKKRSCTLRSLVSLACLSASLPLSLLHHTLHTHMPTVHPHPRSLKFHSRLIDR